MIDLNTLYENDRIENALFEEAKVYLDHLNKNIDDLNLRAIRSNFFLQGVTWARAYYKQASIDPMKKSLFIALSAMEEIKKNANTTDAASLYIVTKALEQIADTLRKGSMGLAVNKESKR